MKTRLTSMTYLGYSAMDRRFSAAMLPWIFKEILTLGITDKLSITIEEGHLKAFNGNFEPVLVHRLVDIISASQVPGHLNQLFYIYYNEADNLLHCYMFQANTACEVTEVLSQMRETSPTTYSPRGSTHSLSSGVTRNLGFHTSGSSEHLPWTLPTPPTQCHLNLNAESPSPLVRSTSNASALTSLCADLSPSESHFFEVLYIGKVRISQRAVPESLIDDALVKFAQHEAEKARINQMRRNSLLSSTGTSMSTDSNENLVKDEVNKNDKRNKIDLADLSENTVLTPSTTPLEPDKTLSHSVTNISKKNDIKTKNDNKIEEKEESDDEFDMFTKERVVRNNNQAVKRNVPLEPNVLILNVQNTKNNKINLHTVTEDEENYCSESNISKNVKNTNENLKNTNENIKSTNENNLKKLSNKDTNPFKDSFDENSNGSDKTADEEVFKTELFIRESNDSIEKRQDSPAPLNFEEINRKPKLLQRSKTGLDNNNQGLKSTVPENKPFLRDRSASIGTLNLKTPIAQLIGEQNRTMLFQVGRSELRLISPDRKQILLHRSLRDVACCVVGRSNAEHFGFVCRESTPDSYACFVFKCESDSIAHEVVNAIKQAFIAHADMVKKSREKSPNMTCEHCPMLWYHRLCNDVDGMNEKKSHAFILRRIEQLTEEEQDQIITKYQGGTNHMYEVSEHIAFLMMLLRAHCEAKQLRHVHDTAENRSEFLNQYLGGSTIFMKAKRSLSSGFDHLLKRKASRDDIHVPPHLLAIKKDTSPIQQQQTPSTPTTLEPPPDPQPVSLLTPDMDRRKSTSPGFVITTSGSKGEIVTMVTVDPQPVSLLTPDMDRRKSTSPGFVVTTGGSKGEIEQQQPPSPMSISPPDPSPTFPEDEEKVNPDEQNSSMMDIFLKVSDARPAPPSEGPMQSSWRQAIYQRVQPDGKDDLTQNLFNDNKPPSVPGKRTKSQLRELWRMAIDQTLLLVQMEKENAKLREKEESSAVRRIKLEYTELGTCDGAMMQMWDTLLSNRKTSGQIAKIDRHMLTQPVIQGVPRMLRGAIWYFLAEQACLRSAPPDTAKFPLYNTPYRTLLADLTKHQHSILIDLGRTFPQHEYFASPLGPGQLSLYNILKAYSLLDPDVGYCQGLSFVAGVLLLHMEEAEAFILLRHLMFRRGLRKQYLPDMSALQVQLYQLSRLLKEHSPELHAKLDSLDITVALYAAPWMLTLFTSQFPLGFVVRVFDLIFLDSIKVVFSVSLALLLVHKDGLMLCESCEEAAEYLKHKLPDIDNHMYEKVMKMVHSMDITKKLTEYAVEYTVLKEEMPKLTSLAETNKRLVADNRRMSDELDSAMEALTKYQSNQAKLESQVKTMEQHLSLISRFLTVYQKQELPGEIKKIVQLYNKKTSFGSKIFASTRHNSSEDDDDPKKNFKTGVSAPNLFAKISKEDVYNAMNKEKSKTSPENENRKHFIMKKSQSVHSGLIANQRQFPLKVLEESNEVDNKKTDSLIDNLNDIGKKNGGLNTQQQITQERLFEKKLKMDFDENLKKSDGKLAPTSYMDDLSIFQSRKSMSLNFNTTSKIVKNEPKITDSGFTTPVTPFDEKKEDNVSIISHPLSDCDIEIKFDGHSTALNKKRPIIKNTGRIGS